jgi:hypothetical protein
VKCVFTCAAKNGEDDADNDSDNDNNSHTDQTTPHPRWIPKQEKDSNYTHFVSESLDAAKSYSQQKNHIFIED